MSGTSLSFNSFDEQPDERTLTLKRGLDEPGRALAAVDARCRERRDLGAAFAELDLSLQAAPATSQAQPPPRKRSAGPI